MASVSEKVVTITFQGPFHAPRCAVVPEQNIAHEVILALTLPLTRIQPVPDFREPLSEPYHWACRVGQLPEKLTVTSQGAGKVAISAKLYVERDLHYGTRSFSKPGDWEISAECEAIHTFTVDPSARVIHIENCKTLKISES